MYRSFATVVAALCLLALTAVGAGAQPLSHAQALQEGDPAATAPSFSEDADGAVYDGKPVGEKVIMGRGLSCLAVDVGPDRCYDTPAALEAAEASPRANVSRSAKGPRARAATDCGIYSLLFIYTGADYTGASAAFEERGRWANLRAEVDNEGSSFLMGEYSGHLAENQGGGGNWYPGSTAACAVENNLNRNGSGWNNRISSRYRN
jgi:hypothetical protein